MSAKRESAYQGWAKLLKPEVLRSNLIVASLFLAAYESLRASIIDRVRDFFADGFDGGSLDDEHADRDSSAVCFAGSVGRCGSVRKCGGLASLGLGRPATSSRARR